MYDIAVLVFACIALVGSAWLAVYCAERWAAPWWAVFAPALLLSCWGFSLLL